jgi:hypothetical protein
MKSRPAAMGGSGQMAFHCRDLTGLMMAFRSGSRLSSRKREQSHLPSFLEGVLTHKPRVGSDIEMICWGRTYRNIQCVARG